ncbi:hypothetical protein DFJ74DRAFT_713614 [Hyaloraphidium curvatum]|nr:hypothetical protein DFJ74DRAFT_713614 [Hyaloraphidium curvatum]
MSDASAPALSPIVCRPSPAELPPAPDAPLDPARPTPVPPLLPELILEIQRKLSEVGCKKTLLRTMLASRLFFELGLPLLVGNLHLEFQKGGIIIVPQADANEGYSAGRFITHFMTSERCRSVRLLTIDASLGQNARGKDPLPFLLKSAPHLTKLDATIRDYAFAAAVWKALATASPSLKAVTLTVIGGSSTFFAHPRRGLFTGVRRLDLILDCAKEVGLHVLKRIDRAFTGLDELHLFKRTPAFEELIKFPRLASCLRTLNVPVEHASAMHLLLETCPDLRSIVLDGSFGLADPDPALWHAIAALKTVTAVEIRKIGTSWLRGLGAASQVLDSVILRSCFCDIGNEEKIAEFVEEAKLVREFRIVRDPAVEKQKPVPKGSVAYPELKFWQTQGNVLFV